MMPSRLPEQSVKERADDRYFRVYQNEVGHLNRADRRTAHGRQLTAEAHAKALQAKVEFLEQEIDILKGAA